MMPTDRQHIYQNLEYERLMRKFEEIRTLYEDVLDKDWNRVLLSQLFRYFSNDNEKNKKAYAKLASLFDYSIIRRESSSWENLEAMFLVASGTYRRLPINSYTKSVIKNGRYLFNEKYKMEGLELAESEWSFKNVKGGNDPILRISQLTNIIHKNEMLFNKVKSIRTRDEIVDLFKVEARPEWSRYFSKEKAFEIGIDKCDMIGINFVVPMLYAIGNYFGDDDLCDAANNLNEDLPAENNQIITRWRNHGLTPTSAFETQALLQLTNCYCKSKTKKDRTENDSTQSEDIGLAKCEECSLFTHMTGKTSLLSQVPKLLEL